MADIQKLAEKAAERMRAVTIDRNLRFLQITQEVVTGSGVTNPSDVEKITRQVRAKMRELSLNKRRATSQRKKDAAAFTRRMS